MARGKKGCKTRSCKSSVHARGYCQKCYDKMRKKNASGPGRARKCKTTGCDHAHHAQGYCQQCYDKVRKTSKEKVRAPVAADAASLVCKTDGCKNDHHAKGYCKKCYSRLRRNGSFKAGEEPRRTVTSRADKGRKRGTNPVEVMGLLIGKPMGGAVIVQDAIALPVEGFETRVVADDAQVFMTQLMDSMELVP